LVSSLLSFNSLWLFISGKLKLIIKFFIERNVQNEFGDQIKAGLKPFDMIPAMHYSCCIMGLFKISLKSACNTGFGILIVILLL